MSMLESVQLTLFGSFHIEASQKNIMKIIHGLKNDLPDVEYLPTVLQNQQFVLYGSDMQGIPSLEFFTSDQRRKLIFLGNRIDSIIKVKENTSLDWQEIAEKNYKAIASVMKILNLLGNRLAVNMTCISQTSAESFMKYQVDTLMKKEFQIYKKIPLDEWSMMMNARKEIDLRQGHDTINLITGMQLATNIVTREKKIMLHLDINTTPEHYEARFGSLDIEDFLHNVEPFITEIQSDFERLDRNAGDKE